MPSNTNNKFIIATQRRVCVCVIIRLFRLYFWASIRVKHIIWGAMCVTIRIYMRRKKCNACSTPTRNYTQGWDRPGGWVVAAAWGGSECGRGGWAIRGEKHKRINNAIVIFSKARFYVRFYYTANWQKFGHKLSGCGWWWRAGSGEESSLLYLGMGLLLSWPSSMQEWRKVIEFRERHGGELSLGGIPNSLSSGPICIVVATIANAFVARLN